jgi:hypothetical protein
MRYKIGRKMMSISDIQKKYYDIHGENMSYNKCYGRVHRAGYRTGDLIYKYELPKGRPKDTDMDIDTITDENFMLALSMGLKSHLNKK